jgi:hypothetical protein
MPPFLPESQAQFLNHVSANPLDWYQYCQDAYNYMDNAMPDTDTLQIEISRLQTRNLVLEEENRALTTRTTQLQAVIDFQKTQYKEQLDDLNKQVREAETEKDKAIALAQPAVPTPHSSPRPTPQAKTPVDLTTGTPTPAAAAPSDSTRQSEKLPDPDRFNGDRKDLRRFASQIHEKMNVNRDRFPTSQSRMAYVTNRLSGNPYNQVLPHIQKGVCQLRDYEEILQLLERAYGDPNRVNNARSELFRYRQTNKEFSVFLAEFQRLGLEAEMTHESLSTLLEQAVSKELRAMLVHNPPPNREYPALCAFLQELDNRRQYYDQTLPAPRTYSTASAPKLPNAKETVTAKREHIVASEPMDLSVQYRPRRDSQSDKATGNCFRCHKPGHRIRECPLPDTRPTRSPEPARRLAEVQTRPPSPPRLPASQHTPPLSSPHYPVLSQPTPVHVPQPNRFTSLSPISGNGVRLD